MKVCKTHILCRKMFERFISNLKLVLAYLVETLRSACMFMCRLVMLSIKKHFGTSRVISDEASMYVCSLVGVFCSRNFSVKQLTFEIYII